MCKTFWLLSDFLHGQSVPDSRKAAPCGKTRQKSVAFLLRSQSLLFHLYVHVFTVSTRRMSLRRFNHMLFWVVLYYYIRFTVWMCLKTKDPPKKHIIGFLHFSTQCLVEAGGFPSFETASDVSRGEGHWRFRDIARCGWWDANGWKSWKSWKPKIPSVSKQRCCCCASVLWTHLRNNIWNESIQMRRYLLHVWCLVWWMLSRLTLYIYVL